MEIGPPDTHHLSAAIGWIELGNCAEAKAEFAKVDASLAKHPLVLETGWSICAAEKDWDRALLLANELVEDASELASAWLHRAYAARRASGGGLEAAWKALLPAVDRFPEESTIPYNLACYACQMNRMEEARRWFQRALAVGEKARLKTMALADPDLEPLWAEIKGM